MLIELYSELIMKRCNFVFFQLCDEKSLDVYNREHIGYDCHQQDPLEVSPLKISIYIASVSHGKRIHEFSKSKWRYPVKSRKHQIRRFQNAP